MDKNRDPGTDTGWYLWNVPGPATTTAKVRIRYHETPTVTDTSDAVFRIVEYLFVILANGDSHSCERDANGPLFGHRIRVLAQHGDTEPP